MSNINLRIISKPHAYLFKAWSRHIISFKRIGIKLLEELGAQGTHCLFTFIVKMSKKRLSSNCKKVSKINLMIKSKAYAHFQSMAKTSVKFQKNQSITVGGVAHTRHSLSIHFHCENVPKMSKFKLCKKCQKLI